MPRCLSIWQGIPTDHIAIEDILAALRAKLAISLVACTVKEPTARGMLTRCSSSQCLGSRVERCADGAL